MMLLLNTHTFLWFILSDTARNLIEDLGNQRFLSIASLWEISIKVSIGKLDLGRTLTDLLAEQVYGNAIELLEIRAEHLDELAKLPFHHKEVSMSNLLITQARPRNRVCAYSFSFQGTMFHRNHVSFVHSRCKMPYQYSLIYSSFK